MGLKDKMSALELAYKIIVENKTLPTIAKEYNVSRQRIHQLYKEYKEAEPELFVRELPSKSELQEELSKNSSIPRLAQKYNLRKGMVKTLIKKYGLKKTTLKDILTKELLEEYMDQKLTDSQIANIHNCSANTIMKARYENKVYKKTKGGVYTDE